MPHFAASYGYPLFEKIPVKGFPGYEGLNNDVRSYVLNTENQQTDLTI